MDKSNSSEGNFGLVWITEVVCITYNSNKMSEKMEKIFKRKESDGKSYFNVENKDTSPSGKVVILTSFISYMHPCILLSLSNPSTKIFLDLENMIE